MKKLFLFAALFAAVTLNAKEIVIDLNTGAQVGGEGCSAVINCADGVATVNWTVVENYEVAGVEFPVENLDVTSFSFEFKGDGKDVGILPYLRDSEGNRWWHAEWISLAIKEWTSKEATSFESLWDGQAKEDFGKNPITKVGFIANPGYDENVPDPFNETGTFQLRNVKIVVPDETAVENVAASVKATKVVRDGQVLILRDGKTYNALGAEMK